MKMELVEIPTITSENLKNNPYYTVLSIELGNTTLKSIITSTNLKTNETYQLHKEVILTKNIRDPKVNEKIFGSTLWEKPLSKEAIEDIVSDIILSSLHNANLKINDLDFVVRSTGIVAVFDCNKEIGYIIKALANGCIKAGITPSLMRAAFSKENLPFNLRQYSYINNVSFDGSVVSVNSPKSTNIVANAMEGELVTAGIKLGSKSTNIDYRNPVISIDMGTTLAGQIIDNSKPYANIKGIYCGLAGGILDYLLQSLNYADSISGSNFNLSNTTFDGSLNMDIIHENTIKIHDYIFIKEVPLNCKDYGKVPLDTNRAKEENIKLIGATIQKNEKIIALFKDIISIYTKDQLMLQIDDIYAYYIKKLIKVTSDLRLLDSNMVVGITGRSGITGNKPKLIKDYIEDYVDEVIFVPDGLALGATMMARCMNSMGTPSKPIGGSKNGMCIMQQRIHNQKKK